MTSSNNLSQLHKKKVPIPNNFQSYIAAGKKKLIFRLELSAIKFYNINPTSEKIEEHYKQNMFWPFFYYGKIKKKKRKKLKQTIRKEE